MEDDLISEYGNDIEDNIKSGGYGTNMDRTDGSFDVRKTISNLSENILLPKIAFYIYLIMTVLAIIAIIAASAVALKDGNIKVGITGMIFGVVAIAPLLFITFVLYNCKEGNYNNRQ